MAVERPKNIKTSREQKGTDEQFFDSAKVNQSKLSTIGLQAIVESIVTFGEILADVKLYPYEKEFAQRIIYSLITSDGATLTGLFARQSGKSTTVAVVITACSIMLPLYAEYLSEFPVSTHIIKFKKGFWAGVYGPDYERASIIGNKIDDILDTPRARELLTAPDVGMVFPERLSSYTSSLPRNSKIIIKSANRKVSIEGDTFHLVCTDETQEIDDVVLKKSISPMLASTNGTTVHIGSAYPERVYFYDVCKLNKTKDVERAKKKQQHFEYDYKVVQKYNEYYKAYIEKEKEKLGEYSDEFRMSYELYFPLERGMFVTEQYLHTYLGINKYVTNHDKYNDHVIGLDIAKERDSTVATILQVDWENKVLVDPDSQTYRRYKEVKNWLELSGDDYDSQFYMLCEFFDNYRWSILVVDATGVGNPIYDRLKNKYEPQGKIVIPFVYNRYDKSYAYSLLNREILSVPTKNSQDKEISKPRLVFPDSPDARQLKKHKKFIDQMTNLVKTYEGGYMVVKHSSETGFDDYPDSLMLAVYGAEEPLDIEAEEILGNALTFAEKDFNFWKNENRNRQTSLFRRN